MIIPGMDTITVTPIQRTIATTATPIRRTIGTTATPIRKTTVTTVITRGIILMIARAAAAAAAALGVDEDQTCYSIEAVEQRMVWRSPIEIRVSRSSVLN